MVKSLRLQVSEQRHNSDYFLCLTALKQQKHVSLLVQSFTFLIHVSRNILSLLLSQGKHIFAAGFVLYWCKTFSSSHGEETWCFSSWTRLWVKKRHNHS